MAELSAQLAPAARKISAAILHRLASVGQVHAADAMHVSESTVSRLKSEHLESFSTLLAALELKVVPAGHKCYDPTHIEHLLYFAGLGMKHEAAVGVPELEWDDAP